MTKRRPIDVVLPEIKRPTVAMSWAEDELSRLLDTPDDRVRTVVLIGQQPRPPLRRWFASRLLEHGLELDTIRQLLGHKDVATTTRYLGINSEELVIIRKFGGRRSPVFPR